MWIPADAADVKRAVAAGELEETATFDAKEALPSPKRNVSVAIDIAAMATDGGVIVYGIAEDDEGRPARLTPIDLNGAADRISQIISTSISEVPDVTIRELPLADDPSRGYLVVVVPQSPRAPHQVSVKDNGRFYGRDARGNRILNEGDVARLYERRERWQISQEQLLAKVIENAPLAAMETFGFVHTFLWPVGRDVGVFERVLTEAGTAQELHRRILGIVGSTHLAYEYAPNLARAPNWGRHGAGIWRLANVTDSELADIRSDTGKWDPTDLATVDFHASGRIDAFNGRATDDERGVRYIVDRVVAGTVEAALALGASFYRTAGYVGTVNVGVAVTGLRGARGARGSRRPYPQERYVAVERVAAQALEDAPLVTNRLLRPLWEAATDIDGYNPFERSR